MISSKNVGIRFLLDINGFEKLKVHKILHSNWIVEV